MKNFIPWVLVASLIPLPAMAAVPLTMSYQGVLTDNAGVIPPDGLYNLTFTIYDDPTLTSGHLLWTEDQPATQVTRGGFSVILGMGSPALPLSIAFDRQYFLGISVNAGAELMPRTILTASPYSLNARSIMDGAVTSSSIAGGHVLKSLNTLHDDVILAAGANVTITPSGQTLTIAAAAGGGLGGSGTTNNVAKFTSASALGNSALYETAGKVGIGTTIPTGTLEVVGSTSTAIMRNTASTSYAGVRVYNDLNNAGRALEIDYAGSAYPSTLVGGGPTGESASIATTGAYPLVLGTSNTARMFVSPTGLVGVGTTTPGVLLDVGGPITGSARISSPGPTAASLNMTFGSSAHVMYSGYPLAGDFSIRSNGATAMIITKDGINPARIALGTNRPLANRLEVDGDASKTTAGSWLANSDARIKAGVRTIAGALEKLDQVRLVSFRYTSAYLEANPTIVDRQYMNVIAQEFGRVFPEHVKGSGARLPNGEEILQVDTYPLTIYSAAAIQELHQLLQARDAAIVQLRRELTEQRAAADRLETRFSALEKAVGNAVTAPANAYSAGQGN